MKIRELISELSQFDLDMDIHCSVDCDIKEEHDGRRVFGAGCRGANPYHNQAVLLFDLESINFKADEDDPEQP